MNRTYFMLIGYGAALACLILQACFETRAAQYFDFKSGSGGHLALAEIWLERARYAFWAGLACTVTGSGSAPFRSKWENLALAVCAVCVYGLISILF